MIDYKVLIIIEDTDRLELLAFILKQVKYNILTAINVSEGFEAARREKPDLIISDANMADGSGIELCRMIRADAELHPTPILLISAATADIGNTGNETVIEADDYLRVPFEPMYVIAKAARLIERRRVSAALRESENQFRSFIEHQKDITSVLALDGKVIYETPSAGKILGYEGNGLIGKNVFDYIHPNDKKRIADYLREIEKETQPSGLIEYDFRHKDNSWRRFQSVVRLFNDSFSGSVIIVNTRDITEHQKVFNDKYESEIRFHTIFENVPIGILRVDSDSMCVQSNSALQKMLGYSYEELRKMSTNDFTHPEDIERSSILSREVFEGKRENFQLEKRYIKKSGEILWAHLNVSVIRNSEGEVPFIVGMIEDITERKQTNAALRFQKTLLEAQSETSIDGILLISPERKIIFYNNLFAEMWEISGDDLVGKSYREFINIKVGKMVNPQEFLDTVDYLTENPLVKDQAEFSTKDGRVFERYTSPIIDADETHYGRVWYFRDITKRKQVEEAIRFQADLLDTVEQAVIATNLSGTVTYWNRFANKFYGWTSAEAIGRNIMELTTPDSLKGEAEFIMEVLSGGKGWSGEFLVQNKDGRQFAAQISNSPVFDSAGDLIGVVGVSYDLTERKEAEQSIIEANKRAIREYDGLLQKLTELAQTVGSARDLQSIFRSILNFAQTSVPCSGIYISRYDRDKSSRRIIYLWYNDKEWDVSEFDSVIVRPGGPVGQAIESGEALAFNDYLAAAGKKTTHKYLGYEEDSRQPRSAIIAPMKIMGNTIGTLEVQSYELDAYTEEHITIMRMTANLAATAIENVRLLEQEQSRAEQLRQSQKLESVGRLAGGIAHDFNNMLTAINGYSGLILRQLGADDPIRPKIEEIKKAGERSAALTNQLLAFSRQQVLKPKVLDVNEVIIETGKMLQRLIGEDVQFNFSPGHKVDRIEVDPGQLTQVIINLAVNARDAMPDGGKLVIETANVYLDEKYVAAHLPTKIGAYVMMAVSDTGAGMDDETLQHIFEPFYTTKEIGKGTGLGLATVYGIVKQSGGFIWVYSEVGQGTIFKIYFPRILEEGQPDERINRVVSMPVGTETILLVEDEETVRRLGREVLESCGYRVIEAQNGVEALEICRSSEFKIDLLLTDVVMPKMGGRELGEKLLEIYPGIRRLYMSGYTDDAVIRQGMITEDMNFIQKPFTLELLAQKIRKILDAD